MSKDVFPARVGRILRDFSSQVVISIAASAVAAAVLAFPDRLALVPAESVVREHPMQAAAGDDGFATAFAGKFGQRYGAEDELANEEPSRGLTLPATLLMPMSVAWAEPVPAEPEPVPIAKLERLAQPVPAVRTVAAPARERGRTLATNPQPLQIAQVLQAPAPAGVPAEARESATLLGVALPGSVTRAGRALGGVVDTVGAAGSWTVSAASNLLPSWSSSAR